MAKQKVTKGSSRNAARRISSLANTGHDLPTATYFREWLEEERCSTYMQKPDFLPTRYDPRMMEEGLLAKRVLAVFYEAYFLLPYCQSGLGSVSIAILLD